MRVEISNVGMVDGLDAPCIGRSYNADDVVFDWTVTSEGDFQFSSVGTGRSTSMRIWPDITVRDATGTVYHVAASGGAPVEGMSHFAPGNYEIHVNDTHYGWAENLEGGAGFSLNITQVGGTPALPADTDPAAVELPAADETAAGEAAAGELPADGAEVEAPAAE